MYCAFLVMVLNEKSTYKDTKAYFVRLKENGRNKDEKGFDTLKASCPMIGTTVCSDYFREIHGVLAKIKETTSTSLYKNWPSTAFLWHYYTLHGWNDYINSKKSWIRKIQWQWSCLTPKLWYNLGSNENPFYLWKPTRYK